MHLLECISVQSSGEELDDVKDYLGKIHLAAHEKAGRKYED